ncbi:L,D-transpeptidase [Pseudonocardia sp. KRD291]|uniref:L,D-transpeptidase n=1 Tax=Pseudonocardia sp. KRD291 TaxID=2792007 RepID=UPI001C4A0D06|nr:L,D-transpeptidase [Pseudonocardia sp. KRD291]MBW0106539.1 L,D-transpeptidase [Pseudonocardia sp. KRD291]
MKKASFSRARTAAAVVAGLITMAGLALAGPASASDEAETSPVARAAHAEPLTPGTPCSVSARSCVDLESQQAWLIRDGKVIRGPVRIASGGADQQTPVGHSFRVYRKDKDHVSGEFNGPDGRPAPMPYSIFFADGGVAFHGGDRSRSSAGCIKLELGDAQAWFNDLQNGDKVQVVNASTEMAARRSAATER